MRLLCICMFLLVVVGCRMASVPDGGEKQEIYGQRHHEVVENEIKTARKATEHRGVFGIGDRARDYEKVIYRDKCSECGERNRQPKGETGMLFRHYLSSRAHLIARSIQPSQWGTMLSGFCDQVISLQSARPCFPSG